MLLANMSRTIYQNDLAYIHHAGFGGFAAGAAPGLLHLLRRAALQRGTLVDLGCGSGIWARAAQDAGFEVVGVDSSPAMIRLARRVSPHSRFHCASFCDWPLPTCDVVTAIGEGLNYLPAGGGRRPGLGRLFESVSQALRPGGLLVFDVLMWDNRPMNYRTWREGEGWAVGIEVSEQRARRRLERRIVTFREAGGRYRRAEEIHRLHLFTRAEIGRALRRASFAFRITRGYGKLRLAPRRLAFVARNLRPSAVGHRQSAG